MCWRLWPLADIKDSVCAVQVCGLCEVAGLMYYLPRGASTILNWRRNVCCARVVTLQDVPLADQSCPISVRAVDGVLSTMWRHSCLLRSPQLSKCHEEREGPSPRARRHLDLRFTHLGCASGMITSFHRRARPAVPHRRRQSQRIGINRTRQDADRILARGRLCVGSALTRTDDLADLFAHRLIRQKAGERDRCLRPLVTPYELPDICITNL